MKDQLSNLNNSQLIDIITILSDKLGSISETIIQDYLINNNTQEPVRPSIETNHLSTKKISKTKTPRTFDISKYHQRHISLQLQYEGEDYYGFASQLREDEQTIEQHLFSVLTKLRLIESRQTCNYSRCGRTDRGVSAMKQVIALNMRSAFPLGTPLEDIPKHPNDSLTIKINKHLPDSIRVISWCEVTSDFNARFSATYRTYRYFFKRKNLNIDNMSIASELLLGQHDFRNFCKLDVVNVSNYVREIYKAKIIPFTTDISNSYDSIWMLEIKGVAFLWHMVRCIMAILLLIGENKELPDIITNLFDINTITSKPTYEMANELPLLLYDCGYDNLQFKYQPNNLWLLSSHYQHMINKYNIAISRLKSCQLFLQNSYVRASDCNEFLSNTLEKNGIKLVVNEIDIISDNSDEPCLKKIKLNEENNMILFKDVINLLANHNIYIDADSTSICHHIPLLKRNRCESYEQRLKKIPDKERSKVTKSDENEKVDNTEFFLKMRKEGSL